MVREGGPEDIPFAALWDDLVAPLILALVAGAVAAVWPWLQTYWRGRKFQGVIRRELEEVGPHPTVPVPNTPWWEHLRKRFVHEEVFARDRISTNRDFLLSLNPDVVYRVSQLWIAFERRDAKQWLYFLGELAKDPRVGGRELAEAHAAWAGLLEDERSSPTGTRTRDLPDAERGALLEARLAAYGSLFALTRYGPEGRPASPPFDERQQRAEQLTKWYYDGGGLLLSSEAFVAFRRAGARLTDLEADDTERWCALSALRTELKIDLGVRHPDLRDVEVAMISEHP